jgi:hypothetical protein
MVGTKCRTANESQAMQIQRKTRPAASHWLAVFAFDCAWCFLAVVRGVGLCVCSSLVWLLLLVGILRFHYNLCPCTALKYGPVLKYTVLLGNSLPNSVFEIWRYTYYGYTKGPHLSVLPGQSKFSANGILVQSSGWNY